MGSHETERTMRVLMIGYHRDATPQYVPACDENSVRIEEDKSGLKTGYMQANLKVVC